MKNKKVKYIVYSIIITLILAVGFSFAFFTARLVNNNKQVTIKAGQLNIIFTDTTEINTNNVRPDWTTSKTFTVENQSNKVFYYNIYIKDLINTLVTEDYLQYRITSTNGYNMTEFKPISKSPEASKFYLANMISINGNTTQSYTIEFRYLNDPDVDQSEDMGKNFSGQMMIEEEVINPNSLYAKLTNGKTYTVGTRGSYDSAFGTSDATTGVIYKESTYKEDGLDVYYFAGNVNDNWVKFAGFYWRIIRTNEDGSVRLLYAGTSPETTSGHIGKYTYSINSSTYNNTMYVGWKYGSAGGLSNNRGYTNQGAVKTALDSWYSTNITGSNANMVSTDAIYCNDRSGDAYSSSSTMAYAGMSRLYHNNNNGRQPTYKCGGNSVNGYLTYSSSWVWNSKTSEMYSDANIADKFTSKNASNNNGNKQLDYPVGLMTADEVAFAGGIYGSNSPYAYYYLNSAGGSVTGSDYWWTMSPSHFYGTSAYVFFVYGAGSYPGHLSHDDVTTSYAVRPVVSLKSSVLVSSGEGTASSPYEVTH